MEEVKEEEDVTMGINRRVEHDLLTAGEGLRLFLPRVHARLFIT